MYKAKKYPSICHLPNSKHGRDDKGIQKGMADYFESKYRPDTRIIVTEKVDGSNVSIFNDNGKIMALSRGGYDAEFSNYQHHREFAKWVKNLGNIGSSFILPVGHRVIFEDLSVPHGTIYKKIPKLLLIDWKTRDGRLPWENIHFLGIPKVQVVYSGAVPVSTDCINRVMPKKGFYGAKGGYEGLVYRMERFGEFQQLAKWVRSDCEPLKYLKKD